MLRRELQEMCIQTLSDESAWRPALEQRLHHLASMGQHKFFYPLAEVQEVGNGDFYGTTKAIVCWLSMHLYDVQVVRYDDDTLYPDMNLFPDFQGVPRYAITCSLFSTVCVDISDFDTESEDHLGFSPSEESD